MASVGPASAYYQGLTDRAHFGVALVLEGWLASLTTQLSVCP